MSGVLRSEDDGDGGREADRMRNIGRRIRDLLSPYASDEIAAAERKLSLYPAWVRILALMDSFMEASLSDPYSERVSGGKGKTPDAQRITEAKEGHPEYQRILKNVEAIERGIERLTQRERDFVARYWWNSTEHSGDHRQQIADELGWGRNTVEKWRSKCILRLIPHLQDVDIILVRAQWLQELGDETSKKSCTRSTPFSCV